MIIPDTRCDSHALSTMLAVGDLERDEWEPQDLQSMLRHQFNSPLYLSMGILSAEVSHELRTLAPELPQMTLGQLLHHPKPPLDLLKLVKRFAKMCRSDPQNSLPPEVAILLYYASITVALLRWNESITHLAPESIRRGLKWLSRQQWIPEELKSLLATGVERLESPFSQSQETATG